MKNSTKLYIAGIAVSAMLALSPSNAFARCYDATVCNTTAMQGYNAETWMGSNDVLGADEEYVPGYETPGEAECMGLGEPLGEGYEQTALPAGGCGAGPVSMYQWAPYGKRRLRKKWKMTICVPYQLTAEYALITTGADNGWGDRGVGGCAKKVWRFTNWPTGERCDPTSATPDCQG